VKGFLRQIISLHAGEGLESTKLEEVISCDILTGAALLIPVETVKKIGNFDDVNFPHHLGDFEFSRRSSLAGFRCLVATKSRIYTEYNRNYAIPFLLSSTRTQYIKSLFNNPKYYHGIRTLLKSSYMHKSILIGSLLFGKEIVKLLQNLTLKVILPNNVLRAVYSK
jgi:GT2 family glycosyltransferase